MARRDRRQTCHAYAERQIFPPIQSCSASAAVLPSYPDAMGSELVPMWRRRDAWCLMSVAMVLLPALIAPPVALVVAGSAALALIGAIMHWPYRGVPLAHGALAIAGLSILVNVVFPGPADLVLFWLPAEMTALLLLLGRVVRRVPGRAVLWTAAAVVTATLLLSLRFTMRMAPPGWLESVVFAAMVLFPTSGMIAVGAYLRSLDARRVRAVAQARRDQRLRVAGDLHDFVAHEVTGIVLEAQAALVSEDDPDQTRAVLSRIEQAGVRALDSMDHTLRTLRDLGESGADDGLPARPHGLTDVAELVERFAAGSSARVELTMPDDLAGTVPPAVASTCHAVVLEALTNIRRHAVAASTVVVSVERRSDGTLEMSIRDDGGGGGLTSDRRGGGTGLVGIEERVRTIGGTLSCGPRDGGWQVHCLFPAAAPTDRRGPLSWRRRARTTTG